MKINRPLIVTAIAFFTLLPTTALAYIDPGTGSMIIQLLGVAFIALSGFFVVFKNRIKDFFSGKKRNKDEDAAQAGSPESGAQASGAGENDKGVDA